MTPTPISSDIPNKVFVDQALAEMHTENTVELSQILRKTSAVGGTTGGDHYAENMWPLKCIISLTFPRRSKKKKKEEAKHQMSLMHFRYSIHK